MDAVKTDPQAPANMVVYTEVQTSDNHEAPFTPARVSLVNVVKYELTLVVDYDTGLGDRMHAVIAETTAGPSRMMRASKLVGIMAGQLITQLLPAEKEADERFANTDRGRIAELEAQVKSLREQMMRYGITPKDEMKPHDGRGPG